MMQDDRGRSGSGGTRRDFIKMFGAAAAGSVAGLLLPRAAGAEDSTAIIEEPPFAGSR